MLYLYSLLNLSSLIVAPYIFRQNTIASSSGSPIPFTHHHQPITPRTRPTRLEEETQLKPSEVLEMMIPLQSVV